jgi:hypothetical protein
LYKHIGLKLLRAVLDEVLAVGVHAFEGDMDSMTASVTGLG